MRVTIDRSRCHGHVRCHAIAPEVYQLDEEGYAVADSVHVPPEHERNAERGALACPENAIVVER
ncbi:MAG: ferredoxin [Actinobacteria bacterium]|nr:MAG: ferredoxin [Actinomycetota bacterium]